MLMFPEDGGQTLIPGFSCVRWRYVMQNRIVLVDEYDQIYDDILPFLSLPPSEFRRRVTHLKTDASLPWRDFSFSFSIRDGHVQTPGAGESTGGKDDLLDIIDEIASMLPDLEVRMNKGDEPAVVISGEAKKRHNDLAERHKSECGDRSHRAHPQTPLISDASFHSSFAPRPLEKQNPQYSRPPPCTTSQNRQASRPGTRSALPIPQLDESRKVYRSTRRRRVPSCRALSRRSNLRSQPISASTPRSAIRTASRPGALMVSYGVQMALLLSSEESPG